MPLSFYNLAWVWLAEFRFLLKAAGSICVSSGLIDRLQNGLTKLVANASYSKIIYAYVMMR